MINVLYKLDKYKDLQEAWKIIEYLENWLWSFNATW